MKFILFTCLLLFSFSSFSNSQIGEKTVSKIIFHDSGNLYVYFSGSLEHTEQCDHNHTYVLDSSHKHFNHMFSGLLAALHAKSPVNGWVNGCINIWGKTKPKITRLDFMPN